MHPHMIDAAMLAIVRREVGKFKGIYLLPPNERVNQSKPDFIDSQIDDLISFGNEALWKAQKTFQPDQGATWTTWATKLVRQAIRREAKKHSSAARRLVIEVATPLPDLRGAKGILLNG